MVLTKSRPKRWMDSRHDIGIPILEERAAIVRGHSAGVCTGEDIRLRETIHPLGVRVIGYESGVHTSLEAATRRNIMGGLVRRIGTLNCGHAAFPILMGVNSPQYTPEQLQRFREDNAAGVTYEGKQYTGYEATQFQRKVERAIRKQKNRILVDEAAGDEGKLLIDRIRLQRLNQEYARYSKAVGLPTQRERAQVAGFGQGQARAATAAYHFSNKQLAGLQSLSRDGIINTISGYSEKQYMEMLAERVSVSLGNGVTSLPQSGTASSIFDLQRSDGTVKQRRVYGGDGKTILDYDTDDHGKPKYHTTGAHKHVYDYGRKQPHGKQQPLSKKELELNQDIIQEGVNYHAPKTK